MSVRFGRCVRPLLGLAAALLAGNLGGRAARAAPRLPLAYGEDYSAMQSVYALPIVVAQRHGYFLREGLDFSIVLIRGGGEANAAALDQGEVDLSHIATPYLIQHALRGPDVVAIAAEFDNPIYTLVANPKIKTYADLKGRVLGMADEAGSIAYSTWKLLALHGVTRADVATKTISGTPQRLDCLESGACDAVPLGQPQDFLALDKGFRRLGLSTQAVPSFLYTATAASRAWAATHKETVERYLRALADALRYIRDPAHRGDLIKLMAASEGGTEDSARQTLSLYLDPDRHVLPRQGEIDLQSLQQVIEFMQASGALRGPAPPVERFVDLSYLRAAGLE